jgi:predicted hydrocarbon binding protein
MTDPLSSRRTERILIEAMEEVLGEQGLRSVFRAAQALSGEAADGDGPMAGILWPEHEPIPFGAMEGTTALFSCLLAAFEEVYGSLAGRGLALRVGRAAFPYVLREYGDQLGLTATSFRLLPFPSKLRSFGTALASLFNEGGQKRMQIEEQEGKLLVHLLRCPLCTERKGGETVCLLAVGLAEESLYWMSGGKIFRVEEIACAARGDADCTLQIDQAPIS